MRSILHMVQTKNVFVSSGCKDIRTLEGWEGWLQRAALESCDRSEVQAPILTLN